MTEKQQQQYGNEVIRFGDWVVTESGVLWAKAKPTAIFVSKDILGFAVKDNAGRELYDMLIQLSRKTWMTELEMYQLNAAYFYAIEYFKVEPLSIMATLTRQRFVYDERKDFDDSEPHEIIM